MRGQKYLIKINEKVGQLDQKLGKIDTKCLKSVKKYILMNKLDQH